MNIDLTDYEIEMKISKLDALTTEIYREFDQLLDDDLEDIFDLLEYHMDDVGLYSQYEEIAEKETDPSKAVDACVKVIEDYILDLRDALEEDNTSELRSDYYAGVL